MPTRQYLCDSFIALQHIAMKRISEPLSEQDFDRQFKPKGAVAFFVLLVILALAIWYGIYFLMLERV
jgi:hypothetical protein